MVVIGLTGSIGMGKSTISQMFADEGVPIWDADSAVHRLYKTDEDLKSKIKTLFDNVLTDNEIDREKLSKILAKDKTGFEKLNAIVHPAVAKDRQAFILKHQRDGADMVLCDIPLLFESKGEEQVDFIIVVSASAAIQRQRVLARPHMTEAKLDLILSRQMPDQIKRERADFVIDTSQSLDACRHRVSEIIKTLRPTPFTNHL
jgi:dephospho-CoA kinase